MTLLKSARELRFNVIERRRQRGGLEKLFGCAGIDPVSRAAISAVEPLESRTLFTATPLYWDPTGASPAAGGAGTWDTATAEWRSGSSTGTLVAWSNAGDANGPYQAVFAAGTGTVALGATITASGISFSSSGYSATGGTGSYPLTLAGGSGQVSAMTGSATISAVIAGSAGLTKTGAGTLNLTGSNTYSGGTILSAGTLDINADPALGAIPSSTTTNITFNGSSTLQAGGSTVTLAATRGVSISSGVTATLDTQSNIFTINGPISNAASTGTLAKAGSTGTLVLAGSNSFVSGTTLNMGGGNNVSAGVLQLANSNALGSNPITVDAHAAQNNANATLALSGGITIGSNVNYLVGGHQAGYNLDLNSVSGGNVFNGTFTIAASGGGYAVQSDESGSTLTLGGSFTVEYSIGNRVITFEGPGNGAITGAIANGHATISTVFSGNTGTLWTVSGTNSYSGGTTLNSGTVAITADAALGAVPSSVSANNVVFAGPAILRANGGVSLASTRGIFISPSVTATLDTQGNTLTVNGPISNNASSGVLAKAGTTGTLVLAGSDSFASGTSINMGGGNNINAGILQLSNSNALGSNPITVDAHSAQNNAIATLTLSGGITLGSNVTYLVAGHQSGYNLDLNSVSGNNTFNGNFNIVASGGSYAVQSAEVGSTFTFGGGLSVVYSIGSRSVTFEGVGNGVISGTISDGSSPVATQFTGSTGTIWNLTGKGSYTGNTTVASGTLLVDGAMVKSTTVTVSSGATLGGIGHIFSTVAISSGATLAPGDPGSTGILTTGPLSLASGSTLAMVLNGSTAGSSYDQLTVNGSVSVSGATLSLTGARSESDGTTLTLINHVGYLPITGTFASQVEGSAIVGGGVTYYVSYTGGAGFDGGTNDGLNIVIYDSSTPVLSTANLSGTSAVINWTDNWAGSSDPTAIYISESGGAYTVVAEVAAGTTTYTLTGLDPDAEYTLALAPAPGGVAPASPTNTPAALSTSVQEYTVTAPGTLSEGIAANTNSGSVSVTNGDVWAASAQQAAQEAGIVLSGFTSVPPSGPTTYTFEDLIEEAQDTHAAGGSEESLDEAFGMAPDQIVLAVEDGTDGDFNDAFAEITVTAV